MQYLIAILIASFCFATTQAGLNAALCYSGFFVECSGPIWVIFLVSSFIGLLICIISTLLQKIVANPKMVKTLIIYTLVGFLAPKAYLLITGSPVSIFDMGTDLAFILGSFIAGLVMAFMWHHRSNPSFKRDWLKPVP